MECVVNHVVNGFGELELANKPEASPRGKVRRFFWQMKSKVVNSALEKIDLWAIQDGGRDKNERHK